MVGLVENMLVHLFRVGVRVRVRVRQAIASQESIQYSTVQYLVTEH